MLRPRPDIGEDHNNSMNEKRNRRDSSSEIGHGYEKQHYRIPSRTNLSPANCKFSDFVFLIIQVKCGDENWCQGKVHNQTTPANEESCSQNDGDQLKDRNHDDRSRCSAELWEI
jgi:hypothetical protein